MLRQPVHCTNGYQQKRESILVMLYYSPCMYCGGGYLIWGNYYYIVILRLVGLISTKKKAEAVQSHLPNQDHPFNDHLLSSHQRAVKRRKTSLLKL